MELWREALGSVETRSEPKGRVDLRLVVCNKGLESRVMG